MHQAKTAYGQMIRNFWIAHFRMCWRSAQKNKRYWIRTLQNCRIFVTDFESNIYSGMRSVMRRWASVPIWIRQNYGTSMNIWRYGWSWKNRFMGLRCTNFVRTDKKVCLTDAPNSSSGCGSYPILIYGVDDGKAYEAVCIIFYFYFSYIIYI